MADEPQSCRTALWCLSALLRHHGLDISADRLRTDYAVSGDTLRAPQLMRMARENGLKARISKVGRRGLTRLGQAYPALARLQNGNWVAVLGASRSETGEERLELLDPLAEGGPLNVSVEQFCARWNGELLLAKRSYALTDPEQPFSLRWFMPEILRQRRLLLDVAVAVVVLYGLGLASPIFFQLVIDKVLVHESYSTLYMLSIGIVGALIFDAAFVFLRRYLLIHATNRIDIRVATRTFRHLMDLPITFFEGGTAGTLVKHMQQASRIREFLTGRLFLTLLDAMSLFVFVPVLFFYSAKLAALVLLFSAAVALIVALMVGPFRRRLNALYDAEGRRQSLLVETIHGMRTVKSLAMEPLQRKVWDERSARTVTTRFEVEKISTAAQAVTGFMEKLMGVAIVGFGALAVFSGDMTIGALVAFNMLAGRVSGPLTQIVTMVHEYQEVTLSVRMLGEVMNQPVERQDRSAGLRPPIAGPIEFEDVTFAYRPDLPLALDKVSFTVGAGSILGLVGRSGSGKTTVTRMIQGLYPPQRGIVRIGGHDLREIDLNHLRQNVGVVLQDNFLFRGTVRENIAAARPSAPFDDIVAAARLAGAEEFIQQLPRGFDTMIEENGANLSGGQKQRLSIARALVTDPRILIFDEATSALDPESEAIVRDSIRDIARGRTVIIVSHRLSTLADANAIMVVEKGQLADMGTHDQLLSRCTTYRQLWNQQMRMAG
ncbi:peptidase domain-containing ABC transporter [Falsirhodobacter algicola]|uniref:ATP-binding cassette domain-containing protein n=1 Tax=Falsirhodobacter algicola TaxID=2692330 RepID=A0A8J8MSK8_9RHOB|nr:peptidase domain-containing ABC transporter [Falsirhodobacter algicola]QUS35689.1 ATP-binding cassette domain-containing protein [Falsirhodobacter algicola]